MINTEKVDIKGDFIKLSQLLKFTGASASGGDAGLLIEQGAVFVNGVVCKIKGKKLHNGDKVSIQGVRIFQISNGKP